MSRLHLPDAIQLRKPPHDKSNRRKCIAVTHTQLIAAVADRSDLSKADAKRVLAALDEVVLEELANAQKVRIGGLVQLTVRVKPATKKRKGRNPATGEEIDIAAKPASVDLRARPLARPSRRSALGAEGPPAPRRRLSEGTRPAAVPTGQRLVLHASSVIMTAASLTTSWAVTLCRCSGTGFTTGDGSPVTVVSSRSEVGGPTAELAVILAVALSSAVRGCPGWEA